MSSYSELSTYLDCARKWGYRYGEQIVPKQRPVYYTLGSLVHDGLKQWYLQEIGDSQEWMDRTILEQGSIVDFDTEQLIIEAEGYLRRYIQYWKDDAELGDVLHVEEEFSVNIGGRVFTFTPDLVVQNDWGVVVLDHKTTGRWPYLAGDLDLQSVLYFGGVKALYPQATGFMWNWIRKKVPTQPRLAKSRTKSGSRIADIGRIDTTYEILRDFALEHGITNDPVLDRRLAELKEENFYFRRDFHFVNDADINSIYNDAAMIMDQIQYSWELGACPRNYRRDCRERCGYYSICRADRLGLTRQTVLENEYTEPSEKNPYESEDE